MVDPTYIDALKRELDGYERYGQSERAAEVRKVLAALGHGEPVKKAPAKKAAAPKP